MQLFLFAATVAAATLRPVGGVDEHSEETDGQVDKDVQKLESCNAADEWCAAKTAMDERSKRHIELLLAVRRGDVKEVQAIFDATGPYKIGELDKTPYGRHMTGITPTAIAARAGNSKMLTLLLANGGTIEVQDPLFEITTLHHAIDGYYAVSIVGK